MPNDFREGPVTDDTSADVQRSPTRWRTVTWGVWRVTRDTAEDLVDAALGEGDDATYIAEAVSWSTRSGTPETRGLRCVRSTSGAFRCVVMRGTPG